MLVIVQYLHRLLITDSSEAHALNVIKVVDKTLVAAAAVYPILGEALSCGATVSAGEPFMTVSFRTRYNECSERTCRSRLGRWPLNAIQRVWQPEQWRKRPGRQCHVTTSWCSEVRRNGEGIQAGTCCRGSLLYGRLTVGRRCGLH